ncbi:hypothetical protein Zmor_022613 [Zophobas morio]|uniref:Rhodanese domain-containing protein n=2 Tax=Zophobas morio TaxID=2755281 RepID=A0AA38HWY5_9CUCU|nr:hypothetical protein Zmor_022613 [Zophobas morio]
MEKKWLWYDWINPIPHTLPEVDGSNFHQKELALAVENNNSTHLKHLLETGGGISLTDAWNKTLIHFAVDRNRLEALEVLLNADGAPIDAEDGPGGTALFNAFKDHNEPAAIKLIQKGANINLTDRNGDTPLLHAVSYNCLRACQLLLAMGVDPNVANYRGSTPLMKACGSECIESLCMLLCYGADATLATTTPRCASLCFAALEVQEILLDYIFDDYKAPVRLPILIEAVVFDDPCVDILFEKVSEVLYTDRELRELLPYILPMNPHYLKLFMELFEDALRDIILGRDFLGAFRSCLEDSVTSAQETSRAIENMTFLVNSHLSACIVRSINKRNRSGFHKFRIGSFFENMGTLNDNQMQRVMSIISHLLTQGVRIDHFDAGIVYMKYGFCSLFKQMMLMDISQTSMPPKRKLLMPQLIYDVQLTIEKFFLNSDQYVSDSLDMVLEHFSHHRLKEFLLHVNDKLERKGKELPEVPLLIELARNETRKHLTEFYNIKNYRQLKCVLEMLELPETLSKILTYEKKLYK